MADDTQIKLGQDDDIMKFINIGEEVGSELDFSEDGGSSVASSADLRFDPSDNFEFDGNDFDYNWMAVGLQGDSLLNAPVDMTTAHNVSEPSGNQASMAMQPKPVYPGMSAGAQDLMQKIRFGAFDTPGFPLDPPKLETSIQEISQTPIADLEYSFEVEQFPLRSRVETQIKCKLSIRKKRPSNQPLRTLLHLPTDTIARPRFQLMNPDQLHADESLRNQTLWLTVEAVNPDVPNEQVLMCSKCLARERRRAFRKKAMDPHEETYWNGLQARRIIIFNCREVVPISTDGQVELPLRIACYCRHHAAKNGYQLFFALRNSEGKILGKAISSKVLITDSHKDQRRLSTAQSLTSPADSLPATPSSVSSSVDSVPLSSSHMRRVSSASSIGMQNQLQQAPLSQQMGQHPQVLQNQHHPYMRPPKPSHSPSQAAVGFGSGGGSAGGSGLNGVQQMPSSQLTRQMQKLHAVPSWLAGVQLNDNTAATHQFSGNAPQIQKQPSQQQQAQQQSAPVVFRVIPHMGSVRGGIEVTLLGQHFQPGLIAMFGDAQSIDTQCWSDSTIIAQLPPSNQLGPVPVTFHGEAAPAGSPASFTYINDGEDKLKEIALQMVGYKVTGKIEDAGDIAQRIIMNDHGKDQSQGQGTNGGSMSGNTSSSTQHNNHLDSPTESAEQLSLWVLRNLNKIRLANINLRNTEGQTMMHIAAMLGYASVVKALIVHGAYVDIQDVSGYTPLHMAVLSGNRNTSRLLLMADADPFNRTLHGLTALELADVTVEELLPKDQRSWYNELNRRGSSSSIASMIEEWRHENPNTQLEAADQAAANTSELISALGVHDSHALKKPPSYSKLFPTVEVPDSVSSTAGDEMSPPPHGVILEGDGVAHNQKALTPEVNMANARVPIIDIEISSADDEDVESSDSEEPASKFATEELEFVANEASLDSKVDEKRRNNEIWNDRMLFTFWIPLSLVTLLGLFAIYIIRGYGSEGDHPMATKIGDMVVNFCTSALDKLIPMPRWNQAPAHVVRAGQ